MKMRILISICILLVGFLSYVASKSSHFHYERSGVIEASSEKIFPYLNSFKLGSEWSPYEKMDPNMKKIYSGPDSGVGAKMEFIGNSDIGSGRLEILKVIPNELVELKLFMLKPMQGENLIQYKLTPEGSVTKFSWAMSGEGNFISKLFGVLIDCEKMVGDEFSKGIVNLKTLMESKK